jgi:hypothetical protein
VQVKKICRSVETIFDFTTRPTLGPDQSLECTICFLLNLYVLKHDLSRGNSLYAKKNPVGYCCVVVFFHRFSVCQGVEALGLSTFFSLVFVSFVAVCLWDRYGNSRITCVSFSCLKLYFFLLKNVPQLYDRGKKRPHQGQLTATIYSSSYWWQIERVK